MQTKTLALVIIVFIACLTQVASELYAPSLPFIAVDLATSIHLVQWSIAVYMAGLAISQLIYGPLSEGLGRKKPIIFGLSLMFIGSIICMTAPNISTLITGRLIQGAGAGACASLWRTIFRDLFSGEELAKYGSYLAIIIVFIVPAAPIIGGYLQENYGWRANFSFLILYNIIALLTVIFGLTETHTNLCTSKLSFSYIKKSYGELLTNPAFMGVTLSVFLSYGAFFSYLATMPVLLIKYSGMPPSHFGYLSGLGCGIAHAIGGWINGRYVKRCGIKNMLYFGFSIMFLSGILLLLSHLLLGINKIILGSIFVLFMFGSTFIWPNAFATAFTPFGHIAGYAGSMYGCMQMSGAAILVSIIAYLPASSQVPLALVTITCSGIAWVLFLFTTRRLNQA